MLNLYQPTDPGWYSRIAPHLDQVLLDHTHLEKRAASGAMNMLFRYTHSPELAKMFADVVHEEIEHFTRMLDLLEKLGIKYISIEPSSYANHLMKQTRKQDPDALLDKLLVSALIEARSCERFTILSQNLEDETLRKFYEELAVSEARHYALYTKMARLEFGKETTKDRLTELAKAEWEAIEATKGEFRLHSF